LPLCESVVPDNGVGNIGAPTRFETGSEVISDPKIIMDHVWRNKIFSDERALIIFMYVETFRLITNCKTPLEHGNVLWCEYSDEKINSYVDVYFNGKHMFNRPHSRILHGEISVLEGLEQRISNFTIALHNQEILLPYDDEEAIIGDEEVVVDKFEDVILPTYGPGLFIIIVDSIDMRPLAMNIHKLIRNINQHLFPNFISFLPEENAVVSEIIKRMVFNSVLLYELGGPVEYNTVSNILDENEENVAEHIRRALGTYSGEAIVAILPSNMFLAVTGHEIDDVEHGNLYWCSCDEKKIISSMLVTDKDPLHFAPQTFNRCRNLM